MDMANAANHVGLGLDHNEQWNRNYTASRQQNSANLSIYPDHTQFATRTSSRMTPSPTRSFASTNTYDSVYSNRGHPTSPYHSPNLPQRSVSEQQYRLEPEPHTRSLARPSEASRIRALGGNASPHLGQGVVGGAKATPERHQAYPPENFSRPRRKNSVQSATSSRGGESPRPALQSSNTFPLALPQSQNQSEYGVPVITRDRGASNSSSIASQYVVTALRPSQSIPDYSMADSVHSNQRNYVNTGQLSSYRPAPRDTNMLRRDPPRSTPDEEEEVRTSFRSALTATSSFVDTAGTERSSVMTSSSSKTSVYGHEGMSVDDALDMYANGFQDSGQSEDEHHPRPSTSHSQRSAQMRLAEVHVHDIEPPTVQMTQPHPLQTEVLLPPNSNTIVRDSHAIFAQPMPRGSLEDMEEDAMTPKAIRQTEVDYMPAIVKPDTSSPKSLTRRITDARRPATSRSLRPATPTSWDDSRDRYGFKKDSQHITRAEYDAWNGPYAEHLDRRRKKWQLLLREAGLPIENPILFPPKSAKVKRFVRKGIPPKWRGAAWFHYGGGATMLGRHPGLYDKLLKRAQTSELKEECDEQIERDLHRTFPDNIRFKPDPVAPKTSNSQASGVSAQTTSVVETAILRSLRRVLQAFSIHVPKIGYCQSLNFLAGLLLLFIADEEKAFWMLVIITHVYLPGTHEVSLEGANVDLGVLMSCIKESMPPIWAKIGGELDGSEFEKEKTSMRLPPITLCCTAWFMSCFIGTLPIETTLRVWDSFFYEGSKTIFRIALAIFKQGETEIRAVTDPMEIFQTVQTIPRRLIDANTLMEACFKRRNGFGHLSQETIETRRRERKEGYADERARARGEVMVRKGTLFGRRRGKSHRGGAGMARMEGTSKEV